jgi:4,4'-diaponeurosporenoate glycosyltransferase
MSYTSIIIHGLFWLFGFIILWKIPGCKKIRSCIKAEDGYSFLSIIIPSRNEEKNLSNLLESINNQTVSPLEVIVVNDDSSDLTEYVAAGSGARVINLKELPDGWVGKSWACYNGALKARGKYFLFLDADTILREDGIERITACLNENKGVVSIQPYHKIRKLYENLSLFFNIILIAGMGTFTPLQKKVRPIGAFGPCLICSRKDYFDIGGHESIKGKIMEDIEIGRKFVRSGIPLNCAGGKNTIDFRMYPGGIKELVSGWSKSFSSGAKSTSIPVLILIIAWIFGAIFPINALINGLAPAGVFSLVVAGIFYTAFVLQIYWMSYRIGSFSPIALIFYPLPMIFFIIIFIYSLMLTLFKRKVTWKERKIKT